MNNSELNDMLTDNMIKKIKENRDLTASTKVQDIRKFDGNGKKVKSSKKVYEIDDKKLLKTVAFGVVMVATFILFWSCRDTKVYDHTEVRPDGVYHWNDSTEVEDNNKLGI